MDSAIEFLLVEENSGDVRFAQESFKDCEIACNLHIIRNDRDALRFLLQQDEYVQAKQPDFILLSSHLILANTSDLLEQIMADATLQCIPIVMVTASDNEAHYLGGRLPISLYITKPLSVEKIGSIAQLGVRKNI